MQQQYKEEYYMKRSPSTEPSPAQIRSLDSEFGGPPNYGTKVAAKQSLISVSGEPVLFLISGKV